MMFGYLSVRFCLFTCLLFFSLLPIHVCAKTQQSKVKLKKSISYSYRVKGRKYSVMTRNAAKHYSTRGTASWYGGKFHGRKTANGSRYNMNALTAASKTLPLGSKVKVTNLSNHKIVTVKITDRGPFIKGRIIDLSVKAATRLGFKLKGTTRVKIEVIAV